MYVIPLIYTPYHDRIYPDDGLPEESGQNTHLKDMRNACSLTRFSVTLCPVAADVDPFRDKNRLIVHRLDTIPFKSRRSQTLVILKRRVGCCWGHSKKQL